MGVLDQDQSMLLQEEERGELPRFCSTFRIDLMAERLPKLQNSREGGEDIRRLRTGQNPMREKEKRLYKEKKEGA